MSHSHILEKIFTLLSDGKPERHPDAKGDWAEEHWLAPFSGHPGVWIGRGVSRWHMLVSIFPSNIDAVNNKEPLLSAWWDEGKGKVILKLPEHTLSFGPSLRAIATFIKELERQGAGAACTD